MLGLNYRTAEPAAHAPGQGRLACYGWGADYHDLVRAKLEPLAALLQREAPGARVRGVVDTAPLLEREFAQLAGLGWIGKHTLLINRRWGSWFFLAALLTDLPLEYDLPHEADYCGNCRACLDACPTGAIVDAYQLDPRKCISYLTIELRSPVPAELRESLGDWLLGCDVCQEVCPWNHKAPRAVEPDLAPLPGANPVDLAGLFWLDDEQFRRRFRATPLWRPKRRGILRNAALVLGNHRAGKSLPALARGLQDAEPLVRGASAWALGRIATPPARRALEARLALETDPVVLGELRTATGRA
jgi:epoxyqueuosine reductase